MRENEPIETNVTEKQMTKEGLLELNSIIVAYAKEYEVTNERAVLDIMKVDSRFSGGFLDSEIAVIMGLNHSQVSSIVTNVKKRLRHPTLGARDLKLYVSTEDSSYESDF